MRTLVAVALAVCLVAVVVTVALAPRDDERAFAVDATIALDYMSPSSESEQASALVGGDYSLSRGESFERRDGVTTVEPGREHDPATALLGATRASDVVVSASVAIAGADQSVALVARSSSGSDYRALVSANRDNTGELQIARYRDGELRPLARATLRVPLSGGESVVVELRVLGTDVVELEARVWAANGSASSDTLRAFDDAADRLDSAGAVGYAAWSGAAGAGAITIDDLKAFSLVETTPVSSGVESTSYSPPRVDSPAAEPAEVRAGSAPIGDTTYPIPTGALVVAPTGRAGANGTALDPLATLAEAIERATPGGTVVLRGGTYHESVVVPAGKPVTIQSVPGEEVWLDGSSVVSDWTDAGFAWSAPGWTTTFDSSPTYTKGAADGTEPGWSFLNEEHPLAAHPDQLWIDDVAQTQVGSVAEVVPGAFFVDYADQTIWLGTDPSGHIVRASDLDLAISIQATDSVIRGVGVRGYAPSVPQMGAVRAEVASATIDNVTILDSATTGLFVKDPHTIIRNVTVARSGMLGIAGSYADDLTLESVVSVDNNTEGFTVSPVAGGAKITRSRGVTVSGSVFGSNAGPGLWLDESVYDGAIVGNEISGNDGHGLVLEISSTFIVAGNRITDNADNGIKVNNTSGVQIWNNTLVGNGRTINIVQDGRRAGNRSDAGHDPRQPFPDPTMTWIIDSVVVSNNILADSNDKCLLCVEDYSKEFTAEQLGVAVNGNVFQRDDPSSPLWLVVWSKGTELNPSVFGSMADFREATGQETSGRELTGDYAVDASGALNEKLAANEEAIAQPLPDAVAAVAGAGPGTATLGVWRVANLP